MDANDFLERMQAIDDELAKKEVPIHARAFHAFPLFAPNYNGPLLGYGIDHSAFGDYEGPNLLEKINNWYKQVYAERFNAPTDRGKVPVVLKREIYLIRIPLVYGTPKIEILPLVNGLTQSMAKHLSTAELNEIQQRFIEGYSLVYEFEDLRSQIDAGNRNGAKRNDNPFLDSALRDMGTAFDCLEGAVDTNGAVFHSQQLAEKMLKAVLFHSENMTEEEIRKKYNHRILDIYNDVCSLAKHAVHVDSEVKNIAKYKMDIRYTSTVVEKGEAVSAYWSGLRIGGLCATLISGHQRRMQP
jgi:HEPN domain-containing protein